MSTEPRWEASEEFPFEDIRWTWCDDRPAPGTVEVDTNASNAYGPPIFLLLERDGATVGMWLDLDTWEALYQAGLRAHEQRLAMTEAGWT